MDINSDLLTVAETAKLLKVKPQTLALWRCTGRHGLPFARCGGRIRYKRAALDKWLTSRTGTSVGEVRASLAVH